MDPLLHYVLQMKSIVQQKQDMENKMPIDIANQRIAGATRGPSPPPPRLEPMIDQEPNTETIKDRPGICANAATIGGWRTLSRVSVYSGGWAGWDIVSPLLWSVVPTMLYTIRRPTAPSME